MAERGAVIVLDVSTANGQAAVADLRGDMRALGQTATQVRGALRQGVEVPMGGVVQSSKRTNQALRSLGFVLNDAQQFSYGFGFGLRAIANNLDPLVLALGGGGGAIFAINALVSALVIASTAFSKAEKEATGFTDELREQKEEIADLIAELHNLSGARLFSELDTKQQEARALLRDINEVAAEIATLQGAEAEQLAAARAGDARAETVALQKMERRAELQRRLTELSQQWGQVQGTVLSIEEEAQGSLTFRLAQIDQELEKLKREGASQAEINRLRRERLRIEEQLAAMFETRESEQAPALDPMTDLGAMEKMLERVHGQAAKLFQLVQKGLAGEPPALKAAETAGDRIGVIYDDLNSKLAVTQVKLQQGLVTPQEAAKEQVRALDDAYERLITNGLDPASDLARALAAEMERAKVAADDTAISFQQVADLALQAVGVLSQAYEAQHVGRMNQIAAERDAVLDSIDRRLDNERISEREKVDLLKKRAQAERRFEEERKEAAREQAKRQKVIALFEIGVNTASAIAEALPNVPLSILAGILGAAQAVAVASTPIPKFARGVTGFPGGAAIVGERGPELVTLPAGANVITNENTERLLRAMDRPGAAGGGFSDGRMVRAISRVERAIEDQTRRLESVERSILIADADESLTRYRQKMTTLGHLEGA